MDSIQNITGRESAVDVSQNLHNNSSKNVTESKGVQLRVKDNCDKSASVKDKNTCDDAATFKKSKEKLTSGTMDKTDKHKFSKAVCKQNQVAQAGNRNFIFLIDYQ